MKRNQLNDIKKTELKELMQKVKDNRQELQNLTLDKATGKLTDLKVIFKKRKDLAQILTVIKQMQLLEIVKKGKDA